VKLYTRRLTGDFLVNEFIMRTQWKPWIILGTLNRVTS
jgi:hypothetical protein